VSIVWCCALPVLLRTSKAELHRSIVGDAVYIHSIIFEGSLDVAEKEDTLGAIGIAID
jgi:hypothetical protein